MESEATGKRVQMQLASSLPRQCASPRTGTCWCAFGFGDFECAEEKVGCVDKDGNDVDGFVEMECEEPDNKCGESFCGTAYSATS